MVLIFILVKEENSYSQSARLVKPRPKYVADSFLFNNGIGYNPPHFGKDRRIPRNLKARKKAYRVKVDLTQIF